MACERPSIADLIDEVKNEQRMLTKPNQIRIGDVAQLEAIIDQLVADNSSLLLQNLALFEYIRDNVAPQEFHTECFRDEPEDGCQDICCVGCDTCVYNHDQFKAFEKLRSVFETK